MLTTLSNLTENSSYDFMIDLMIFCPTCLQLIAKNDNALLSL